MISEDSKFEEMIIDDEKQRSSTSVLVRCDQCVYDDSEIGNCE
jgi:hypothetical protein